MNKYEEALQFAHCLGFQQEAGSTSCIPEVQKIRNFVDLKHKSTSLHTQRQQLLEHSSVSILTDNAALQRRTRLLETATSCLQQLQNNSSVLALRFKDSTAKQAIPVEPQFQEQFSELLLQAAADRKTLFDGEQNLSWTSNFSEQPHKWEQHLQPLNATYEMCRNYLQHLMEVNRSLEQLKQDTSQSSDQIIMT